jgi:hypothetical protein
VPAGTGAAEAGWNWSAPQISVTAGRVEDRFIVSLAVYAVLGTADRPPLNVNDA